MPKIRLKVARSLSEVSRPDDWKWNRWLKAPSNTKEDLKFDLVRITGRGSEQIKVLTPALEIYLFYLPDPVTILPDQFNRWLTKKSTKDKTSLISVQKTYRLFISKIKVSVSGNLVPKDQITDFIFAYKSSDQKSVLPELIATNAPEVPSIEQYGLKSATAVAEKQFEYSFEASELSKDLLDRCSIPDIVFYNIPYRSTQIGGNLIIWNHENALSVIDTYLCPKHSITSNLLATGDKINIHQHYFNIRTNSVTDDLLYFVPETMNIELLKPEEFKVESTISFPIALRRLKVRAAETSAAGILMENYFVPCDESYIHYAGKNKILVPPSRVYNISFNKLGESAVNTFSYDLDQIDERIIPFQELNADYINYLYNFSINGADTEDFEVKDNPVLIPRQNEYLKTKEVFDGFYHYQKEAINFLMSSNKAALRYDHLLDYKPQIVYSLSLLLRQGKIRCALIVKNSPDLISSSVIKEDEWTAVLKNWAPEIPFDIHMNNTNGKLKPISFTTYNDLKHLKLTRFDCIILDKFNEEHLPALDFINASECQRVWIAAADRVVEIPLNYDTVSVLRSQIDEDIPARRYEYRWVQLNKKQMLEYKTQLNQGQLKIYASIDRGEIYIIKPHLFTLLHQLLQTCNFASDEYISAKTDALLQDVRSSNGKVIVLSQYEKFGLERIEKLLRSEGISCVSYKTGSSENEKSLNDFRTNQDIKVLLADVKVLNSRLNTGKISTIIHFDHWWNPVSQWHIEDRLTNTNNVKIIQYCTEETIEEDIYKKLLERELTSRLVFESLTPAVYSDILRDEEWLELYGIQTETDYPQPLLVFDMQTKMMSFSLDELVTMIQKLSGRIGYTKQKTLQHISDREIVLVASRLLNNREENVLIYINMNENVDQNSARVFYEEYIKYKNLSKAFFVTPGRIAPACTALFNYHSHKINFFDGESLGKLLHLFNLI